MKQETGMAVRRMAGACLLVAMSALTGCMTSSVPDVTCWNLEFSGKQEAPKPRFGIARVSQIVARAPYGGKNLAVLRADGSVAFDHYNEFSAGLVPLLKGVVFDAAKASGAFKGVVGATSSAGSDVFVEVTLTRLALDCREAGSRRAVAEVQVQLVDGRDIVSSATGSGAADAADGKYGSAFSGAVSDALAAALSRL